MVFVAEQFLPSIMAWWFAIKKLSDTHTVAEHAEELFGVDHTIMSSAWLEMMHCKTLRRLIKVVHYATTFPLI